MALLAAAVVLALGRVNGAEPEAQATSPLAGAAAGQSTPAPDAETTLAEAIGAGTVLKEMTVDQVLSARGEPLRKQVIPPDAELWHYADGEVAFSSGRISYVDLDRAQRREDPQGYRIKLLSITDTPAWREKHKTRQRDAMRP
jgi:hypothetical protein